MRIREKRLVSFIIAILMLVEMVLPSFNSLARGQDKIDPYSIQTLDEYKKDESVLLTMKYRGQVEQVYFDEKKDKQEADKKDSNLIINLLSPKDNKDIKFITRKNFDLFDTALFASREQADQEFKRVKAYYAFKAPKENLAEEKEKVNKEDEEGKVREGFGWNPPTLKAGGTDVAIEKYDRDTPNFQIYP